MKESDVRIVAMVEDSRVAKLARYVEQLILRIRRRGGKASNLKNHKLVSLAVSVIAFM